MNYRALVAEFVGTFALVFIGAGTVAVSGNLVAIALAHGLTLMVMIYAYGHISGAHINPAVTVALWVNKKIESRDAVGYIVVQLLGGIIAGFFLALILGSNDNLGATTLAGGVEWWQGLLLEAVLTFFLVNSVYNTAVSGKGGPATGVTIGLTLGLSILMGGPLTGASLNPARTLGPAVASGTYADIWVYFVGTVLGGVAAALLYRYLKGSEA